MQVRPNGISGVWADVPQHWQPSLNHLADNYRRRPDPPPMPDEVWVSKRVVEGNAVAYVHKSDALCADRGATPVRYIRAGAVIPATQTEWRYITESSSDQNWKPSSRTDVEYRIKP